MTAHELVAKARNLPPVSHAALKLVSLLDQQATGNEEIVQVLKFDSVLTAKLLKACNSPAFAFDEPVTSVDQAVLLLGYNQLLHIVLSIAFGGAMAVAVPGYAMEATDLWRHALTAATAAEAATIKSGRLELDASVAFTIGLLHDIGKLVLAHALTPQAQAAVRQRIAQAQCASAEAERAVLGTDHAEVGACLLHLWRLPPEIVEAVANHHRPPLQPQPQFSAMAHIADCLAHLAGATPGWDSYALRGEVRVAEALGLDSDTLERLVIGVRDTTERVNQFITMA